MPDPKKRLSVAIFAPVYEKVKEASERKGKTVTDYVNETLMMNVERDNFLKLFAPHLSFEYASEYSIFIKDSTIDKTAIIKIKWHKVEDLKKTGCYVYCETDDSDSCCHVKYALLLPDILKIKSDQGQLA